MKTRGSWGIVYVAVVFAVLAIGTAYATSRFWQGQRIATATGENSSDWQSTPGAASASSPGTTALSDTLSEDAYSGYLNLAQQGTFTAAEQNQMLAGVVKKDIQPQNVVPELSLAQLNLVATTSLQNYISLVAVILNQSTQIKQEESYVFGNTVQKQVTSGTPTLMTDASIYLRIAEALLVMEVPPSVAGQHLELVKSVGGLSNAVKNMGEWSGDPIQALQEVDTYNKAKAYVENSANTLMAAVQKLEAQQKS
jgi:hypothetical protein